MAVHSRFDLGFRLIGLLISVLPCRRVSHHLFDGMRTIAAARDRDRFCDLTDDLLWHVLSFLPSDVALQTCVLDTRWRALEARDQPAPCL